MVSQFYFEEIKKRYKVWFRRAIREQHYTLPYYEIQSWDKMLNAVAHNIFDDIKCLGVPLYPVYPISEFDYIHFGNPFIKIGIEIAYKNSSREKIDRKLKRLPIIGTIEVVAVFVLLLENKLVYGKSDADVSADAVEYVLIDLLPAGGF